MVDDRWKFVSSESNSTTKYLVLLVLMFGQYACFYTS